MIPPQTPAADGASGDASPPRLRELFEHCAELAPTERAEFVAAQALEPDTLRLLQALLDADACTTDMFSNPPAAWAEAMRVDAFDREALVGSQIGGFRVCALLGEGGSAVVFRGERLIGGSTQVVALKLLRNGLFSSEAQRRFRRELDILAQLSHPNIARLIDAGVSAAGVPYIATELIDGLSLSAYAERNLPEVSGRLRLLAELARTVDAAHRALVVHRDLKPSNVLVTAAGEIKVLDFGIAKTLGDPNETETRHLSLTPGYAAPEQYASGPVTTAVDVYALGVIAGELLLGQRLGADAQLPKQPEDDAHSRRRRWMQLDPDLAVLLSVALADDPAQRYASARHFADDIERFLRQEPITARVPTRSYRFRKFVRRHAWATSLATAFVLSLMGALGLALWQAQVARAEAQRASSVSAFVEGLFAPLRDGIAEGKQPSLTELVALGAARIDASPDLGAAARVDLLLLFARVNDYLNERAQMEQLTARASVLADAELGMQHPLALEAAVSHALAVLRTSDYARADSLLRAAELRLREAGPQGYSWIRLHDGLALLANDRGAPDQALQHARISLDARIVSHGEDSDEAIGGYANLAFALEGLGEFERAAAAYRRVYESRVARTGAQSSRSASALTGLGAAELLAGDLVQAKDDLRGAMAVFDSLGGLPRSAHVQSAQQACTLEIAVGSDQAGTRCAHAVSIARQAESPASNSVARALRLQGQWLTQAGDYAEAERVLLESQALFAEAAPSNWRGRTDVALGELRLLQGEPAAAAQLLARGVERLGKGYPPYLRGYGLALLALACEQLSPSTASDCTGNPQARAEAVLDADRFRWNPLLLPAHSALAQIELAHGQTSAAQQRLQQALGAANQQLVASLHPRRIEAALWQQQAHAAAGDCALAHSAGAALEAQLDPATRAHPLLAQLLRAPLPCVERARP